MRRELFERALSSVLPIEHDVPKVAPGAVRTDRTVRRKSMTTLVAFQFKHGIMCAADRQTTSGYFDEEAYRHDSEKICVVAPHTVLLGSGYTSSIQHAEEFLKTENRSFYESSGFHLSPEGQARSLCRWWRALELNYWDGLMMHAILAGVVNDGTFCLYDVGDASFESVSEYTTAGSGGPRARDALDMSYRPGLTARAALDVAVEAIFHAGLRDNFTSDVRVAIPRVTVIGRPGVAVMDDDVVVRSVARILKSKAGPHGTIADILVKSMTEKGGRRV